MRVTKPSFLLGAAARPLRFGLVGLSGVAVNTALLWVLVRAGLPTLIASALATEAAILHNFLLNDHWTFQASGQRRSALQRLLRFNGVALGGLLLSVVLLMMLTAYTGLSLLPANLLAIGGATAWNYLVNSRWTWTI